MLERNIPFSLSFVISTTLKHMQKCIDMSIAKTVNRIAEFEGNVEKSTEIVKTLSVLHQLKGMVTSFQNNLIDRN